MGSLELALGAWRGGSRGERGRLGLAWGWLDRFPHPFRWRPVLYKRLPPGELSARRPISWSAWVRRIWSPGGRDPPRSKSFPAAATLSLANPIRHGLCPVAHAIGDGFSSRAGSLF